MDDQTEWHGFGTELGIGILNETSFKSSLPSHLVIIFRLYSPAMD
jgi:hypothetical protein